MHIPDNYLSPSTCAAFAVVMVPVWYICIKKMKELPNSKLSLVGVSAAFSFLIMMFNVPVPGGTTAHAIGSTLAAVLIGPYAACIAVSSALFIQATVFGDGGILSFCANCFNMAFVAPFVGYLLYKVFTKKLKPTISIFIASYIGLNVAALCAAIEFGIQPILFHTSTGVPLYAPYPLSVSIPAMLIPHLTIAGLAEACFSAAVLFYIQKVSPQILQDSNTTVPLTKLKALILVLIALCPLGLLAGATAWGEWDGNEIKDKLGYIPHGMEHGFSFDAWLSGYDLSSLHSEILGYILSAIIGVALLTIIFKIVYYARSKKSA